ncbi:MAG: hypothetical protein U0840_26775 [Gemmataceae bacterium]
MGPAANIRSIELIQRLETVLQQFIADAQAALVAAEMEVRRTTEELQHRLDFWKRQVLKRQEMLGQARAELAYARALHKGSTVGCVEQELAVHKAMQRVREAEEKVSVVQRWLRQLPELIKEFEGPARTLSGFVDADLRQWIVHVQNKIRSLEAYLHTPPT